MSKLELIKAFADWVETLPEEKLDEILVLIKKEAVKPAQLDMDLVKKILSDDKNLFARLAQ
jgi:hypothetical protein